MKKLLILTIILAYSCQSKTVKEYSWEMAPIPTIEQVGTKTLPSTIAPIKAPFPTQSFKRPEFPNDTIRLSLSSDKINTLNIQKAITKLSQQGGGTILVPAGNWLTGRIQLMDNINLHFEEGSILRFSGDIHDYKPAVFTRIEGIEVMSLGACIYANGATNIAITGKGQLIGPEEGTVRSMILTTKVIDDVIDPETPVKERVVDGFSTPYIFPPMFISPINCQKVYIEGVSLANTAFWNIVPIYCDNVIIRGVKVNSVGIPRGDGIDVESSSNVLIEYCTLSCGDDCFTMKAGRGADGMRVNKPTENVVVRYCLAKEGHGGITCGSETAGMIKNLYVHDCVFENTGVGIRFKTRRPRGGGGENLNYERIRMNLRYTAFKWDMLGSEGSVGELARRLPAREINELTPRYTNITAKNILIENATHFFKVIAIPESPLENVSLKNLEVHCTNFLTAADMQSIEFKNIDLFADDSVLFINDSRNVSFENVKFNTAHAPVKFHITGSVSDSIEVTHCLNATDTLFMARSQH